MKTCTDFARKQAFNQARRGFSLIEILVVITILSLVIGLLLPAVLAAREAARRASCINKLKQMGIAIHSYESTHQVLPIGFNGYSPFAALLPAMDQRPVFDAINFDFFYQAKLSGGPENDTVLRMQLDSWLCPSDGGNRSTFGPTNYAFNWGYGFQKDRQWNRGPFDYHNTLVPLASIRDGTSQTAAASEWLLGIPEPRPGNLRSSFWLKDTVSSKADYEAFARHCEANSASGSKGTVIKGNGWLTNEPGYSGYMHALPPNRPTCEVSTPIYSAFTASSNHPGGVNVLLLDGRVAFFKDSVNPATWRALSTRAGSEVVSGE